ERRLGGNMARSSNAENVMIDEIVVSSHFGHGSGWEGGVVDMDQARGVIARRRKRTAARASASRSSWPCKYWATSTGWQKCTSDIINNREVSRELIGSNSPASTPSRRIDSKTIRMCSLCARIAPQLSS